MGLWETGWVGRKPIEDKRVQLNRYVAGGTTPLLKSLAEELKLSEGEVIDRAIQTLAICESFGPSVIKSAIVVQRETASVTDDVVGHHGIVTRPKFVPPKNLRHQRRSG
jgi:hypothetical protein